MKVRLTVEYDVDEGTDVKAHALAMVKSLVDEDWDEDWNQVITNGPKMVSVAEQKWVTL